MASAELNFSRSIMACLSSSLFRIFVAGELDHLQDFILYRYVHVYIVRLHLLYAE